MIPKNLRSDASFLESEEFIQTVMILHNSVHGSSKKPRPVRAFVWLPIL